MAVYTDTGQHIEIQCIFYTQTYNESTSPLKACYQDKNTSIQHACLNRMSAVFFFKSRFTQSDEGLLCSWMQMYDVFERNSV